MIAAAGSADARGPAEFAHQYDQGAVEQTSRLQIVDQRGHAAVELRAHGEHVAAVGILHAINIGVHIPASEADLNEPRSLVGGQNLDRKSTRLNSSHLVISYAVF